jgi:serine/threonine protein kinase
VECKVCKGLDFIHGRGIAHLDVKPDNIYVKNGIYKLGDFGCATLIDRSLAIEEGDSRYMPPEMLNDKYEHLDKVDIFSLGAAVYELIRGTPLPESGPQFASLREGKISLLPGRPMQFQSLIKVFHHHRVLSLSSCLLSSAMHFFMQTDNRLILFYYSFLLILDKYVSQSLLLHCTHALLQKLNAHALLWKFFYCISCLNAYVNVVFLNLCK